MRVVVAVGRETVVGVFLVQLDVVVHIGVLVYVEDLLVLHKQLLQMVEPSSCRAIVTRRYNIFILLSERGSL